MPDNLGFGLALALGSAATINLGFLLQHRALGRMPQGTGGTLSTLRQAFGQREWLAGQALGILGFAAQVVAVTLAPLALVLSFAAGGLAISLPLAAALLHQRVARRQAAAVLAIAAALATLPLGLPRVHEQLHAVVLGSITAAVLLAAMSAFLVRSAPLAAVAAGLSYGVADAAIKALSVRWGHDGAGALLSIWLVLVLLGTGAGFVSFQAALRSGHAVTAVTLMTAVTALVALACGLVAFDERFGKTPLVSALHFVAVAVVLGCVAPLAAAEAALARDVSVARPATGGAGSPPRQA